VDLPRTDRVSAAELVRRLMTRLRPHADELGSTDEFDCLEDILENGTGSARQIIVFEANHDLQEVVREIVEASVPEAAEAAGE
jgi:carboxylate-amine ligase